MDKEFKTNVAYHGWRLLQEVFQDMKRRIQHQSPLNLKEKRQIEQINDPQDNSSTQMYEEL